MNQSDAKISSSSSSSSSSSTTTSCCFWFCYWSSILSFSGRLAYISSYRGGVFFSFGNIFFIYACQSQKFGRWGLLSSTYIYPFILPTTIGLISLYFTHIHTFPLSVAWPIWRLVKCLSDRPTIIIYQVTYVYSAPLPKLKHTNCSGERKSRKKKCVHKIRRREAIFY